LNKTLVLEEKNANISTHSEAKVLPTLFTEILSPAFLPSINPVNNFDRQVMLPITDCP